MLACCLVVLGESLVEEVCLTPAPTSCTHGRPPADVRFSLHLWSQPSRKWILSPLSTRLTTKARVTVAGSWGFHSDKVTADVRQKWKFFCAVIGPLSTSFSRAIYIDLAMPMTDIPCNTF